MRFKRNNPRKTLSIGRVKQEEVRTFKGESNQMESNIYDEMVKPKVGPSVAKAMRTFDFHIEERYFIKFGKGYVRFVENPGSAYIMQEAFNMEGYFAFQVTSLSANLCLLEDIVEGELETLVKEGKEWLSQLFKEVKP